MYAQAMGEELGSLFYWLWEETAWLFIEWSTYENLFGKDKTQTALLNEVAPLFFRTVQDALWDQILLHISRLTDRPGSGKTARLTIQRLPALITDQATRAETEGLVKTALEAAGFCRDWRNRRIAHLNLGHCLAPHVDPLTPASREKVSLALRSLVDVLDGVSLRYMGTANLFDYPQTFGVDALLKAINHGLCAQREPQGEGCYTDLSIDFH